MDLQSIFQATAEIIREIPRSGLLIATVAAVVGSILGTGIARHYSKFGRFMATTSTMALAAILVVVMLQVSRSGCHRNIEPPGECAVVPPADPGGVAVISSRAPRRR